MEKYSVLMAVYYKENPSYLRQAIDSMLNQTVKADELVLVCDGPLTDHLDRVVNYYKEVLGDFFKVIRLDTNMGLSMALNEGLKHCKNDLVARMDSDDISFPDRCERQLEFFEKYDVDILSGTVLEFNKTIDNIVSIKKVPLSHEEIVKFAKRRSPFNHPAVMYRKSSVLAVGGYNNILKFEDYSLWINLLCHGYIGANIGIPVLYMRCGNDLYKRRGGFSYVKNIYSFEKYLRKIKYYNYFEFIFNLGIRSFMAILPNGIRKIIYLRIIRK